MLCGLPAAWSADVEHVALFCPFASATATQPVMLVESAKNVTVPVALVPSPVGLLPCAWLVVVMVPLGPSGVGLLFAAGAVGVEVSLLTVVVSEPVLEAASVTQTRTVFEPSAR